MRPEVTSNTTASAISAITSAPRLVRRRRPVNVGVATAPVRIASATGSRAAARAGTRPATRPVKSATATATRIARPSRAMPPREMAVSVPRTVERFAAASGAVADRARTANAARTSPAATPSPERMTLSVRSCLTSRPCPAPIASRTASSRRRAAERASSRFATFTHAMSSNSDTATASTITDCPTIGSTRSSWSVYAVARQAGSPSGG